MFLSQPLALVFRIGEPRSAGPLPGLQQASLERSCYDKTTEKAAYLRTLETTQHNIPSNLFLLIYFGLAFGSV